MIVRIATEGQYELSQDDYDAVNALDNEAVEAAQAGDEARFREVFQRMIELVKTKGRELGDEELRHSDVILPPHDTSIEEARREFSGEGLIPESLVERPG